MKTEKVISAVRKARADFKKTPQGQYAELYAQQMKWLRRRTIADNKLAKIRKQIEKLLEVNLSGGAQ